MKRFFSPKHRHYLFLLSGGYCALCGCKLFSSDFHGDHVVPFSKGGVTTLANGQALCSKCNTRKGARHESDPSPS